MTAADVAERTGTPVDTVALSIRALEFEDGDPFFYRDLSANERAVQHVTGKARRTVGAWPSAEAMAKALTAELELAADREADEERKGWLRNVAAWLGGPGREVAVDVAAAVINRQISGA